MSEKRDSRPAFPVHPDILGASIHEDWRGMTMRDYFAAKAMQGLLATGEADEILRTTDMDWTEAIADSSYAMADAMLRERAK